MSDELQDEVEAINSIYGDGSLVQEGDDDTSIYILQLPGSEASSLKLQFPPTYPVSDPPLVLGTYHSSGGKMGAGARDLRLFHNAVADVFSAGLVCLFDAIEDFTRRLGEEETEEEIAEDDDGYEEGIKRDRSKQDHDEAIDLGSLPTPPWTVSEAVVDMKSTFIAHVAPVSSPSQARLYVQQLLASDRRFRSATHNMTAWRIRGQGSSSFQDCDDDGEAAAGGRLLHLMQLMDVWDAMVVVSRWYGGVKLGPRRFAVINTVARDGFVRAGMAEKDKKKSR